MHLSCLGFVLRNLSLEEVKGKRILEVGSQNVNGSVRPIFNLLQPSEYIGIDFQEGLGVDLVCDAKDMLEKFGPKSFDIVVSTEMMEHILDWRLVISNLKQLVKDNGLLLLTTRSKGFKYHAYPYDFWRYETEDFKIIFSDMNIINLESDSDAPGVFIKVQKPINFVENNLSGLDLYSIVFEKLVNNLTEKDILGSDFQKNLRRVQIRLALKGKSKKVFYNIRKIIFGKMDELLID